MLSENAKDASLNSPPPRSPRELLWPSSPDVEFTDIPVAAEEAFQREFPELRIVVSRSDEQFQQHLESCEILVVISLPSEQFAQCRKLRWIHSPMAGVTQLMYPELVNSDVIVTNGRTVHSIPVAEQAFALMLAFARRLPNCFRYQAERRWGQMESWEPGKTPFELYGKTLGIIGFGTIGRELAARARAFGMRILAVKRDPTRGAELADTSYSPSQLHQLLAESDFVVVSAPQTSGTARLIGSAELAAMKQGAYLINVSRGSLVDTAALLEALCAKRIGGAGLDVTDPEPLPPDHPLWQFPNVVITPHLGGASTDFWARETALLRENVRRYLHGEPLLNLVDKQQGY